MRGLGLAALLIAASSCDPDAARAVEACSVICDCQDAAGDECFTECVNDASDEIARLPAACLSCISDHRDRCLSLEVDCFQGPCNVDDQPPPDPNPDPPVIVDAGVPDPDSL